jgi:hypothetical protein
MKILTQRADALLAEAAQMNVPLDELIDLLHQRSQKLEIEK